MNNMKISPIALNQPRKISHKANNRWVYDKYGNELYKTTTYLFRDDLDWQNLIKFICEKYKNVPKVNFINHACSCGMEPLSFVAALIMYAKEYVQKFTPIIAKDINRENIMMAKNGICELPFSDFPRVFDAMKGRIHDFFCIKSTGNGFIAKPNSILADNVVFEEGDIFKDIENLPKENTFLSCRNFWAYLPFEKRRELAERLSERLNPSSTILVGFHDISEGRADLHLELSGFKRCPAGTPYVNIMYSKV